MCVAQRSAREGKREREIEGAQGHMQCKHPMRGNAVVDDGTVYNTTVAAVYTYDVLHYDVQYTYMSSIIFSIAI
jgi:hypothetical protein